MLFLVVDDDGLSRELVTLLLEAEGHKVEAVASGEEAVARAASQERTTPEVILTDMQMPGLAGDALAKALRATLGDRRTLLLAMSGSRPKDAALTNFNGFLLKPFKVSELQPLISKSDAGLEAHSIAAISACDSSVFDDNASGVPALDEEIYAKLGELMPAEQLGQMYALCVNDARKRIAHMQVLAASGDDAQYRVEAHTVKGGCGMIGAKQLYELTAAQERVGLGANSSVPGTTGVTESLAQLSLACDRLERILVERKRE